MITTLKGQAVQDECLHNKTKQIRSVFCYAERTPLFKLKADYSQLPGKCCSPCETSSKNLTTGVSSWCCFAIVRHFMVETRQVCPTGLAHNASAKGLRHSTYHKYSKYFPEKWLISQTTNKMMQNMTLGSEIDKSRALVSVSCSMEKSKARTAGGIWSKSSGIRDGCDQDCASNFVAWGDKKGSKIPRGPAALL